MGAEESVPLPRPPPSSYPDQSSSYFMFSLYLDTIHLVYAPQAVLNIFVKTIQQSLGAGAIEYHKPKLEHGYKVVFNENLFRFECRRKLKLCAAISLGNREAPYIC